MAHYAILDENNIVVNVITGRDETDTIDGNEQNWEANYAAQLDVPIERCKRTSYNTYQNVHTNGGTPFRGNYAGIGMKYDSTNDVFVTAEAPFPGWVMDTDIWEYKAPVDKPADFDSKPYKWDADAYAADNTTGWVEIVPE